MARKKLYLAIYIERNEVLTIYDTAGLSRSVFLHRKRDLYEELVICYFFVKYSAK